MTARKFLTKMCHEYYGPPFLRKPVTSNPLGSGFRQNDTAFLSPINNAWRAQTIRLGGHPSYGNGFRRETDQLHFQHRSSIACHAFPKGHFLS